MTVIIPTYNRAALLLQALTSVRRQTWPHIQIIVADDGSTDDTAEVVAGMPDVLYVRQEHRGQGAARNLGLRHAKGAYICTLDSDDLWAPDFIESSLEALHTLHADFVFSNWSVQSPDGTEYTSNFEQDYGWDCYPTTELSGWRLLNPNQTRDIYIETCVSPSSALLFPRELIAAGWSEDLKIGDDWCLLLSWVLSRPCRVAVSTHRRWTKRACGDNVSDIGGERAQNRYAYLHDFRILVRRFGTSMEKKERARFHALIAFHELALCVFELRRYRLSRIPPLLLQSIGSMVTAMSLHPSIVAKYMRKIGRGRRPQALAETKAPCPSTVS